MLIKISHKLMLAPLVLSSLITLSACSTIGNMERNTAIGAGLGGIAGAIIGNNTGDGDASTGAAIGAIVGGASGAYSGYVQDQQTGQWYYNPNRTQLYWDRRYQRHYYHDPRTDCTYWKNGLRRS